MKTSIKNLITAAFTFVILTASTLLVNANDQVTVLNDVKKVNKINVAGNVELILVQSENESVKVYDSYYSKNALVQQKDGELRISSYEKTPLTVIVYVNNLREINAADNAVVSTSGKFSTLALEVNLKDKAKANLNIQAVSLDADVKGLADLTLSGYAAEYYGVVNNLSKVNLNAFVAENASIQSQGANPQKKALASIVAE
ncbi:putative auto-transporter adhesin, head GIN domain [compost metagenome]